MKLSTVPVPGAKLIKGTRLLRVIHPHEVDTLGSAVIDYSKVRAAPGAEPIPTTSAQDGKKKVRAVAGDLAIEVADVKTGGVLGYSYLTGEAVTCMNYDVAPHRFEPASLVRLTQVEDIVRRGIAADDGYADGCFRRLIEALQEAKHSDHDVAVLEIEEGGPDYQRGSSVLMEMWSAYKRVDGEPDPMAFRCHLLGLVWEKKRKPSILRRNKSTPYVLMHLQPARHASNHCAEPFQVQLLLTIGAPS